MESKTKVSAKQLSIDKGVFTEISCCMCWDEKVYAANTQKELIEKIIEDGWKHLNSDIYGIVGHWCGCDYKD